MLMTPKMTATISSVSDLRRVAVPGEHDSGTTQAATPSAAADTRIRSRIFMASFYSTRALCAAR